MSRFLACVGLAGWYFYGAFVVVLVILGLVVDPATILVAAGCIAGWLGFCWLCCRAFGTGL